MNSVLHLNLHREWFAAIAAKTKCIEYRRRSAYWKTRLENRKYDVIQFRNGYAAGSGDLLGSIMWICVWSAGHCHQTRRKLR